MPKSKLNLKLLRKVRDRIAEIPESYDQSHFEISTQRSPCGTAACVAGEAVIVSASTIKEGIALLRRLNKKDWRTIADAPVARHARKLFGISKDEAEAMFNSGVLIQWPEPYRSRFKRAAHPTTKAKIAVAYLDECLKRKAVTW